MAFQDTSSIIRKPIKYGRCRCQDIRVQYINGIPSVINIDNMNPDKVYDALSSLQHCPTVITSRYTDNLEVLQTIINLGIPIILYLNHIPSEEVVQKISEITHSGVILPIELFRNLPFNSLENLVEEGKTLKKVLSLAKFLKVRVTIELNQETTMPTLSILEFIDFYRPYFGHIIFSNYTKSYKDILYFISTRKITSLITSQRTLDQDIYGESTNKCPLGIKTEVVSKDIFADMRLEVCPVCKRYRYPYLNQ